MPFREPVIQDPAPIWRRLDSNKNHVAPFGLVDPGLDQAGCGDIAKLIHDFVHLTQAAANVWLSSRSSASHISGST